MTTDSATLPRIDTRFNKFSQACVVLLTAVAFVTLQPYVVVAAAICLAVSAIAPQVGPFRLLYRYIVVPLHVMKPKMVEDDPAPHRFAQGVGAVFLIASSITLFLLPQLTVGWVLDLIVFVLAGLNLTVGFCAGCFVYYQLGRIGITPRVRYTGSFHWRGV
jgi:hypothetical protein